MRAYRPAARRRGPRPVRLVGVPTGAYAGDEWATPEGLAALDVGLEALKLLKVYEPDFWAAHVAALVVTPERLLGAIAAFFQLQHRRGLTLRWPDSWHGDLEASLDETPAETLVGYGHVSAEYLNDLDYFLDRLRPVYVGLGVQVYMDEGWNMGDPLTLALWWLASGSQYDTGMDMDMGAVVDAARGLRPGVEEAISSLRPLRVMNDELCWLASTMIPEAAGLAVPADLIRYAYGQTSNPLANTNLTEMLEVHGEENDEFDWSKRDKLVGWSIEATALETAYSAWAERVRGAGPAGIDDLGITMHAASRTLRRRDAIRAKQSPPTLIDIFSESGLLQEAPV